MRFLTEEQDDKSIIVGANRTHQYLSLLLGKRVGVVANQTSVIFKEIASTSKKSRNSSTYVHLVDSLLELKIDLKKVFSPEHGFRGKADAGELVEDGKDTKTGLPIFSLHGKHKKPTKQQLEDLDIMVLIYKMLVFVFIRISLRCIMLWKLVQKTMCHYLF